MIGEYGIGNFLLGVALGTLGTTFLVWVIIDPIASLFETLLPASRRHRFERLATVKAQREKQKADQQCLLAEVTANEELNQRCWREMLKPQAEELAGLLTADISNFKQAERRAIDIGVRAWQIGGLGCMRQLRNMALAMGKHKYHDLALIDYIPGWWDGIGTWRNPSIG
jgi:hypothetical protein